MIKVLKFGGTSVDNPDKLDVIRRVVERETSNGGKVVIVASAMSGVSNSLIEFSASISEKSESEIDEFVSALRDRHLGILNKPAKKITDLIDNLINDLKLSLTFAKTGGLAPPVRDRIISYGEKLIVPVISRYLKKSVESEFVYGDDHVIITDNTHSNAEPLLDLCEKSVKDKLEPLLNNSIVPVVTGFIGCTSDGITTTLGRGSSDLIASIIGASLYADEVQIWTDVDGILDTDPKIVSDAKLIDRISYLEANELAYFGAKVLHPKTIRPAVVKRIPIRILNTLNPDSEGTVIVSSVKREKGKATAVTVKRGIILIEMVSTKMLAAHGFLAKIFEIFSRHNISVDMLSTTEVSVSITIDPFYQGELDSVRKELEKYARVKIYENLALLCVIGEGMKSSPGLAGKIFSCLGEHGINVWAISQGSLQVNVSMVVDNTECDNSVRVLHRNLF
ncbi:MAG TPA: aspartate kinase [bacterium]|jgi:aspartate kinase